MSKRNLNIEKEAINQILDIGCRMWNRGFVAANDGNISVRINENEILTTPTGVSKGHMIPEMIIRMDMAGKVLSENSGFKPSSEAKMHIQVYRQREDIRAVVHAHPPYCTSFAVAGMPLDKLILPEAILTLGAVPVAPYGTPSTSEIPDSIQPLIENSDAVLLANHGALTLGADLTTAWFRMETLEHYAHICHLTLQLGNVNVLSRAQIEKLMKLRTQMNISGRVNIP